MKKLSRCFKVSKLTSVYSIFLIVSLLFMNVSPAMAIISNGENAADVLGQFNDVGNLPVYTRNNVNNGLGRVGLNAPYSSDIDEAGHRLFVADTSNHRVLVYNLNENNEMVNYYADSVLGQSNFVSNTSATSVSGLSSPSGVEYDEIEDRLFVTDYGNHRVLIFNFDQAAIQNGANATVVLGQVGFDTANPATTQTGLNYPTRSSYVTSTKQLFVADQSNNRVMVFNADIDIVGNGDLAVEMLGQYDTINNAPVYTSSTVDNGMNDYGFSGIVGTALDPIGHRLFVSDNSNNRILVYNLDASNHLIDHHADKVLGQANFFSNASAITKSGLNGPSGLAFATSTNRLFVADQGNNRVMVFDVAEIATNGEDAVDVIGQADGMNLIDFTLNSTATTQSGFNSPYGLVYDGNHNHLFISEVGNNRVTVYNVAALDGVNRTLATDVIGQADFINNGSGVGAAFLNYPRGVAFATSTDQLFIADANNNRVTVYDVSALDGGNDYTATDVIGQVDFTSSNSGTSNTTLYYPSSVSCGNGKLFISELSNYRVTVYDVSALDQGNDYAAIKVLGQGAFDTSSSATTQSGLGTMYGSTYDSDNNQLFVSDSSNNRVMIFDVGEIVNGENATDVIGQTNDAHDAANFLTSGANDVPNNLGFSSPQGVVVDTIGHRLFVSDYSNNRILVFNLDSDNRLDELNSLAAHTADKVLGQSDFTTAGSGTLINKLYTPGGIDYNSTQKLFFVNDYSNNRVMVFDVDVLDSGENAYRVLGQADFNTGTSATTQTGLTSPLDVSLDNTNNNLFVTDYGNNRIMVFDIATVANGDPAINAVGQVNTAFDAAVYTKSGANNGPNSYGFSGLKGVALDTSHHRLFVSDNSNHRVLVFDLNSSNQLANYYADHVLGQATFYTATAATTQSGLSSPTGLSYDSDNDRLFVADVGNNRVMVFDVDEDAGELVDGKNASNVIGQANFVTNVGATTQGGLSNPYDVVYDTNNNRLFVLDQTNNRVLVFNTIADGQSADIVLGQAGFETSAAATSESGFTNLFGLAYDTNNDRLFVADYSNYRVMVFNTIANGQSADRVIGQADFTSNATATDENSFGGPVGVSYDTNHDRLFVSDYNSHRVLSFKVPTSTITNNQNADNVLGQANFTDSASAITQSGMSNPHYMAYDSVNDRLFTADYGNNRIMTYNTAPIIVNDLIVSSTTTQSVDLNFGVATVPPNYYEYKIFYKAGSSGASIANTAHTSSTDANLGLVDFGSAPSTTISGLSPSTQYVANIWHYDTIGNAMPATTEVTFYTLAAVPANIAAVANSISQITVSWGANSNGASTEYYVEDANDSSRNSGWIGTTSHAFTGLTTATSYSFKVKARNGNSIETAYTGSATVSTSAAATTETVVSNTGGAAAAVAPITVVNSTVTAYGANGENSNVQVSALNSQTFNQIAASSLSQSPFLRQLDNVSASTLGETDRGDKIREALSGVSGKGSVAVFGSMPANSGVTMQIAGGNHVITLPTITKSSATFIIYSDPLKVTVSVGEEKVIDLDKDGVNDLYVKLAGVDEKNKQAAVVMINLNELPFSINDNNSIAVSNKVNLRLKEIAGVDQMSVSLDPKFKSSSFVPFKKDLSFILPDISGDYTIYVRLRSTAGATTDLSASIKYVSKNSNSSSVLVEEQTVLSPLSLLTRRVFYGERSEEVKKLQVFLKAQKLFLHPDITGFFAGLTKSALLKFQKQNKLALSGYVDNTTLSAINGKIKNIAPASVSLPAVETKKIISDLCDKSNGQEVRILQDILIKAGYLKINKSTGIYAAKTKAAVQKFQQDHKITPAHGCVGSATRGVLNALFSSRNSL